MAAHGHARRFTDWLAGRARVVNVALSTAAAAACPDCGADRPRSLGRLPDVAYFAGRPTGEPLSGGQLLHCRRCDLRYRWPTLESYDALYDNAAVDAWSADTTRKDQRLVLERVQAHAAARTVLDFGCYNGGMLAQLPRSLQRHGVEVSSAAAALARQTASAQVVPSLERLDSAQRFDVIVAMDVIEHVHSPLALATRLVHRLAPGGRLIVTTGDGGAALWRWVGARWWYCYYPEHIAFVSERWVDHHAAALGVRVGALQRFNYLESPQRGALARWSEWLRYLARPGHHARKRATHLARHGHDRGVPGMGLSRDHLLIELRR
jgi:SAM-dependent methyltransferase